ncbi:MAG TPA: ricin-type beta-trefoil lectin domain protein [Rugosimonospora sp.]|nr:ricin-type beta-trefoil lectin domain protein [Rugosimonospora sp.]
MNPRLRKPTVLAVAALALGAVTAIAHPATAATSALTSNQITVAHPPMGWASWNSFAAQINYSVIQQQTDAFVAAGLPAAGYQYVNIDEGWWQGTRDGSGNITVDTSDWPGGMAAIAAYIHSKGLKAGIYTDAGLNGCGYYYPTGRPAAANTGSEGHYQQDFTQFEEWGFDYVKVDWCGGDAEGLDPKTTYQAISSALAAATATTGHPMVLSICDWGRGNPWNWGAGTGDLWRTSADIILYGATATLSQVLTNFDQAQHPVDAHTGYVNDPDMLTVGMSGLTDTQASTEMSLWAVTGAPLLAGNNLATMGSTTASILKNSDVIAVDQDPRGLPGVKVAEDSQGLQVYAKVLSGSGRRAVVLLNRTSAAATMAVRWADLGLSSGSASVRNLWTATNAGTFTGSYGVSVPANGSVMLTVTGTEAGSTTYEAESSSNTRAGSAAVVSCGACSGGSAVGSIGNGSANTLRYNAVSASATGLYVLTIGYLNGDSTPRTATLTVNGQTPTVVAFPPTGSWSTPGTVSAIVSLAKGANTLTFGNASAWAPDMDGVALAALPGTDATEVVGGQSSRCLDINDNTITNGTRAQIWDCTGGANQAWAYTSRKQLVVYGNKCLDAYNNGTGNGTAVVIWDCNGQTNQQWTVNSNGTITGVQSGRCLDVTGAATGNGTLLELYDCNGGSNQSWSLN